LLGCDYGAQFRHPHSFGIIHPDPPGEQVLSLGGYNTNVKLTNKKLSVRYRTVSLFFIRFRKWWVAAFNLAVTNRITSRFADRLPGFGILTHVGRKSGGVYRTPVNVFRVPEVFLIALTCGRESEWVKNVLAAGGCDLATRGVRYLLSAPTIVHDPTRRRFPLPVRIVLWLIGATDFMRLSTLQSQIKMMPNLRDDLLTKNAIIFGDESADETAQRVFAVAGLMGN
jgi:deazaflavin-dependent oxidoreductase (nitroreductase family)